MRKIDAAALLSMKSPIGGIMRHIHKALTNVAKEKEIEFGAQFQDFELRYLDADQFICRTYVEKKVIEISSFVAEISWICSYSYVNFYEKIVKQANLGPNPTPVSLQSVWREMDALTWVYQKFNNEDVKTSWPNALPHPKSDFNDLNLVNKDPAERELYIARDISLCCISYFLHHEFGHIAKNHYDSSVLADQIDMERDADYHAVDFILSGIHDESDFTFQRRHIGIAIALLIYVVFGIRSGKYGGKDHPRSFDRLTNVLGRYFSDEDHPVWAFVINILKLHLDHSEIEFDKSKPYDTFYSAIDDYVEILSMQPKKRFKVKRNQNKGV